MFKRPKHEPPAEPELLDALALDDEPVTVPDTAAESITTGTVPQGTATYEIEDFAALSNDEVAALHQRAAADHANGLQGCAHLVVTHDLTNGQTHHHVPCGSGVEAFKLAAQVIADQQLDQPDHRFVVSVTPLLPH